MHITTNVVSLQGMEAKPSCWFFPYLFVLSMERLGALINKEVLSPVKVSKEGPCFSHLFFCK